jgi:hypothetical protein
MYLEAKKTINFVAKVMDRNSFFLALQLWVGLGLFNDPPPLIPI